MFDFQDLFQWDRFITPTIIKTFYWLVIAVIVLFGISGVLWSLTAMAISPFVGFIQLLASIASMFVGIVFSRIIAEFILIVFRINEHLGAIRDRSLLDRFVERVVGPLIGDDSRHQPVLMPTLEAWFAENGNLALAAQRLNVHRNTLSYRLQRIEALTGCSFEDPHDRLNISVALLIRRLSSPA